MGLVQTGPIDRSKKMPWEAAPAPLTAEQWYRNLILNVPAVLWTADVRGRSSFVSGSMESISGFSSEELAGPRGAALWHSRVHPDDVLTAQAAFRALLQDGAPYDVEYRFRRNDGRWIWLADRATHTYEVDGITTVDAITIDITERKQAERQQWALSKFSRSAVTTDATRVLIAEAMGTTIEVLDLCCGDVYLYDAASDSLSSQATGRYIPKGVDHAVARAFAMDAPMAATNVSTAMRSAILAPIRGAESYGVLLVYQRTPRRFTEGELAFVQSMADVLAMAMASIRAQRGLEVKTEYLRRREAQLADAQALAHSGSFEVELERGRVEWSDELYRIAGIEVRSQTIDRDVMESLFELTPENSIERLEAGEILNFESTIRRPDGSPRTVQVRARVTEEGGSRRMVGTVLDVTEARLAEDALRKSETRLRLIVSRLPIILWSTDAELRLTSLTGAGFDTLTAQELADFRIGLRDLIDIEGEENIDFEQALAGRVTIDATLGNRELRMHAEPLRDESGTVLGTVGIAFDISQEKRVERSNRELLEKLHIVAAEWRDTFDSIQTPIVIVDGEGRLHRLNAAALDLSCCDDWSEALGRPLAELEGDPVWGEIDRFARSCAAGVTQRRRVDRDGRSWNFFSSSSDESEHTIIIASEVTELVRLHDKLLRTERMSEMGRLVAGVAHEVRNPLFGISATLDAYEATFASKDERLFASALRSQVDRLSELMHELLDYGRPVAMASQPACILQVVHTAIGSVGALAASLNVRVETALPAQPRLVRIDRSRILQVFENLLKNAFEHSPAGGTVEISATVHDCRISIAVEDRGPGFQEIDLPHIFEPFYTRRRGGTGLGLSLVHRMVEQHNGTVSAMNREGGGARMVVTLPLS